MRIKRKFVLSTLVASMWAAAPAHAQTGTPAAGPPPVEYFFGTPKYRNITLSPDGKLLVAEVPFQGHRNLALIDIEKGSIKMLTGFTNEDIARYQWIGDRMIDLAAGNITDASGVAYLRDFAIIDTSGNQVRDMRPSGRRSPVTIIMRLNDAGDDLVIQSNERTETGLDAYRFNPVTNRKELLTLETPGDVVQYVSDRSGQVRVAVSIVKGNSRQIVSYRRSNGDKWTTLRDEPVEATSLEPIAFGYDNRTLYVHAPAPGNAGRRGLYAFDPDANRLGDLIYESKTIDAGSIVFDENRRIPVGVRDDSRNGTTWFDPEWKRLQDSIDAALPKTHNAISWGRHDPTRIIVTTQSETQPPIFYLLDRNTHQMQQIAEAFPTMNSDELSPRQMVRYPARDGLAIPAFLTLPKHPSGSKPPLIVNIHGGPYVPAAVFGYDADAQFFASRGYAVLEPSFRGTQGFGAAFEQAGWKQWGMAMQDDVTDGVRWLVDTGKVDADRVCLFGGSYGGYATLWGLIKEPQMFRCGVAFVAVADLELFYDVSWSDTNRADRDNSFRNYFIRSVADPDRDREKMRAVSPILHADRIQAPLMLAYGAADQRVPLIHGNQMRSALDKYKKPYEWVVYNDEGHGFNKDENKFDFYRRIDAFLAKNLVPRTSPSASAAPGGIGAAIAAQRGNR